ncbi:methionyl-tRNA formyltransferase [Azospirillum halopraeferens]|uniref:methionyl-tRNA formyltransferase n=1 Tax=Azospirillum halopraeferens TaxID=34010 RepID=UPI0004206945|nr:formyltransferase family protein [Azospirillum halopraeferens]
MTAPAKPLSILLAGEEAAGLQLLQALAKTGHRIVGVLASPDGTPSGGPGVWQAAQRLGLATWPADFVRRPEFAEAIRAAGVDLLLNAHSLHIICPEVLDAPRLGAFNLHPGPLPRYAGLNAPSWAIVNGETEHAVTVHRMVPRVDAGPVAYTHRFPIAPGDSALNLYVKCTRYGVPLMLRVAETLATDPASLPAVPPGDAGRRVYGRRPPDDGWVDWSGPAARIAALVRACDFGPFPSPWGTARASLASRVLALIRVRTTGRPAGAPPGSVVWVDGSGARVACGDEELLIEKLSVDGRRMAAADRLAPGDLLSGKPADLTLPSQAA